MQTPVEVVTSDSSSASMKFIKAIEGTEIGGWLRTHELAWNAIAIVAIFALGFLLSLALRQVLSTIVTRALTRANRKPLADAIAAAKLVAPIAAIAPLLLIARVLNVLGEAGVLNALAASNIANLTVAFAILRGMSFMSRLLAVVDELYSARPEVNRPGALRGYRQVAMVVIGLAAGISAIAIAVGKSPLVFLAALGAVAAVLGVIFKDMVLSLVANIMLSANDAIRVGDWIELKPHGIDGRIAEIKTTTVRVHNADGTVHSVPISRFVQEPYLNYRSKYGAAGRRVRRAFRIDVRSVRALTNDELAQLASTPALAGALERARGAVAPNDSISNLALYRAFAERTLAAHDAIDSLLPIAVSQQEATASGQPVEILCFIKPTASDPASIEGAIIDRLQAAAPTFALRIYQTGSDAGPITGPLPLMI